MSQKDTAEKELQGLTKQDLIDILQAVRQPVYTPEQLAEREAAKVDRAREAALVLQRIIQKKLDQKLCSHMRNNGTTRTVPVIPGDGGREYLICQSCQDVIYPAEQPEVYNKHIQMAQTPGF